jgi:hypothetical protein
VEKEIKVSSYDITNFKKAWKKQYEEVKYSDQMSTAESAAFKGDEMFLDLIMKFNEAKQEVVDYMNFKIENIREAEAVKQSLIKPIAEPEFKEPFE